MTSPHIRFARPADASAVADLVAEAFAGLDLAAWLIPIVEDRVRLLAAYAQVSVGRALDFGEIHIAGDFAAVAVWVHHVAPGSVPELMCYDAQLAAVCGQYHDRFQAWDEHRADHHPDAYPHHHLAFLATRPGSQNHGWGTALLQYHHTTLDLKGVAAYVEARSPRSRSLFERHSYESVSEPFLLADNGPSISPMWREPRRP